MKDPYDIKEQIKEYFHFSKSEQRGVIILLVLIGFFFMLPKMYKAFFYTERVVDFSEFEAEIKAFEDGKARYRDSIAALKPEWSKSGRDFPERDKIDNKSLPEPFVFDPNTASFDDLCRLGLRSKTAQTLIKYREKGGKFWKPDDLERIYGLSEVDFKRLKPYVAIDQKKKETRESSREFKETAEKKNYKEDNMEEEKPFVSPKKRDPLVIKINQATAEEWQRLYGIGPAYANRIVKFRDALGGFYSVEQISEVYGFPDSTFQAIKPFLKLEIPVETKLDINSADIQVLKKHPYLNWKQANAIVNYRFQHGPYQSLESIGEIGAISKELHNRLLPYLYVNDKIEVEK